MIDGGLYRARSVMGFQRRHVRIKRQNSRTRTRGRMTAEHQYRRRLPMPRCEDLRYCSGKFCVAFGTSIEIREDEIMHEGRSSDVPVTSYTILDNVYVTLLNNASSTMTEMLNWSLDVSDPAH